MHYVLLAELTVLWRNPTLATWSAAAFRFAAAFFKDTPLNPMSNICKWEGRVKHHNLPNPQSFPLQQYWHPPLVETQLIQAGDDTCRVSGGKSVKPQEGQSEGYTEHRMTSGPIAGGRCMASAHSGFLPTKKCHLILRAPKKVSIFPVSFLTWSRKEEGVASLPKLFLHFSPTLLREKCNCFHTEIIPKIPSQSIHSILEII